MTEDAERLDDTGEEEEISELDEEVEEPVVEEEVKETKEKTPRGNPLGMLFNIRMLRRFIQIGFFVAINAYILASWNMPNVSRFFISIRDMLPSLPILSPLEAPFAAIAGSFDTLQQEFTTGLFPFFTLGAMIIILIFVGRAPCGWICPIGTMQDFITLPKRTKVRPAPGTEKELRKVKMYIFVIVVGLAVWIGFARITGTAGALEAALGNFANDAFAPLNPAYILFVVLGDQVLWPEGLSTLWYISTWGFALVQIAFVVAVFVISFWVPRWFCRWLCPAGWLYSIFSREALIGIGRNPARCTPDTCNTCEVVCPMNIRIRKFPYQHMHSPDCIMCLECKSHCPNDAIVLRFS
ncbi:MAG: 4Fe-4S binding protein [Candidatus Thorarchaeota archaeon]